MNTINLTDEELRARLMECDYPDEHSQRFPGAPSVVDNVIKQIRSLNDESRSVFMEWWKTGVLKSKAFEYGAQKLKAGEYKAITPEFLRRRMRLKDLAVILYYDWLLKSPREALNAIYRKTGFYFGVENNQ